MQDYQRKFIEFAMANEVLCFGDFTLKSGRQSPYFLNVGKFNTGSSVAELGSYYASAIENSNIEYDILFGPAYKGIPLVTTTAVALARDFNKDIPYCFNRKVAKDHGEGGNLVGAPLQGRVLVVDDVITAGTAFRQVADMVAQSDAELVGMVTAVDRRERGKSDKSATQELTEEFGVTFTSIVSLEHIIAYLSEQPKLADQLARMDQYRSEYGVE